MSFDGSRATSGRFRAAIALALASGCGGKAVIDDGRGGAVPTPEGVDANCYALCSAEVFGCAANGGESGTLVFDAATPTGCVGELTTGATVVSLELDCTAAASCMWVAGSCFLLTWAAPGDEIASALVFGTPGDVWSCTAP